MPSPETHAPVLSAQDLLAFEEDQLIQFLNECRTASRGFDISKVLGVDDLSPSQRDSFSEKLTAAAAKAGSFNPNELSRRLGALASKDETDNEPSLIPNQRSRSPTESLPEDFNARIEEFKHDSLVEEGGRPAISNELLLETSRNAEANREIFAPWLDDQVIENRDDDVLPLFSTQLADWQSFRHKWQLDNRGKQAAEGFSAFLESQKKEFVHSGESRLLSDPAFETSVRSMWEAAKRHLELSGREGFTAYTQAVKDRLRSHNFTQPFQLSEDPRRQDARTTWIEYLNYLYWWQDRYAASMKTVEPRFRKAWDNLHHWSKSPLSAPSEASGSLKETLSATRTQLEAIRFQTLEFIKGAKAYPRWLTAFRRQELRAQWALEQLSSMDTTSPCEHELSEHSPDASASKKRKGRSDTPTRQQSKRPKQEVYNRSSTLDSPLDKVKASNSLIPDERAANLTQTDSGLR
ncbi:hypothetical protein F4777DRAFT_442439 [Nemania sp. FL0916]|nr:hypothetical protein F4777DRAFT_442439 [Nemania sp. FL0916]